MHPLISRSPLRACLTVLALIAALPAAGKEPGWYVGGSVGYGRSQIDTAPIASAFLATGNYTTADVSAESSSVPIRFFFGYDLSKYFGIEGGPFYFTGTGWNAALTGPLGTGSVSGRTNNVLGVNLDMLVKLPLGDRWKVFARGGGLYAQSKFELSSAGATPGITPRKSEERDFGWKAGAGVEYRAWREVAVRLEWERYRLNDGTGDDFDTDAYSFSVLYYW